MMATTETWLEPPRDRFGSADSGLGDSFTEEEVEHDLDQAFLVPDPPTRTRMGSVEDDIYDMDDDVTDESQVVPGSDVTVLTSRDFPEATRFLGETSSLSVGDEWDRVNDEAMTSPAETRRNSYTKWSPDISEISANMTSYMHNTTTAIHDSSMTSSVFDDTTRNTTLTLSSESPQNSSHIASSRSIHITGPSGRYSVSRRESAIQKLVGCEKSYARKMHRGIQEFSRPLRYKKLNGEQHQVLFQNLEKLVAMSDFTLSQLLEKSYTAEFSYIDTTDDVIVDVIGQVYNSRVKLMCEAYETYHAGLCKAFTMLEELNQSVDFCKFSRRAETRTRLSLVEFLERPVRHLASLAHNTQRVLRHTSPEHEDHRHLSEVVDTLNATSKKIQETSDIPKSSLQDSRVSLATSMVSMTTTSSVASSVSESLRSFSRSQSLIDPKLVDMQSRMTFAKDVEPFQLLAPSRHLVYAGELEFVINEQQTIPLWGVLCSDLLLLTTKDEQGNLVVEDNPLYLRDAIHHNFNCENDAEFILVLQNEAVQRAFRLRSPTVGEEQQWKNFMVQRISACQQNASYCGLTQTTRV